MTMTVFVLFGDGIKIITSDNSTGKEYLEINFPDPPPPPAHTLPRLLHLSLVIDGITINYNNK